MYNLRLDGINTFYGLHGIPPSWIVLSDEKYKKPAQINYGFRYIGMYVF